MFQICRLQLIQCQVYFSKIEDNSIIDNAVDLAIEIGFSPSTIVEILYLEKN